MNFQADPTHYMSYICQRGVGVRALATDGVNIFACGRFLGGINSDSTYVPSAGVIKWDGTHWQTMGNTAVVGGQPVGGIYDFSVPDATFFVNSIAVSGTNVFVTGNFLDVTEPSAAGRNLARFSTSGALLDSPSLRVHYPSGEENQGGGWGFDLTMQPGGTVYLGGIFDQIDGTPGFQSVAKWNGSGWAKLDQINGDLDAPAGYGPIAYSVAADADAMYVHGIFDKAGNVAVQPAVPPASFEIARWVTGSNADLYPKITTVVGDHNRGGTYYGDNGPALSAGLSGPTGISFGPLGELLIADTGNRTIRTVSGGTISGMANGYQYFDAPAGVVKDGNGYFYVAEVDWGGLMKFQSLQNIISIGDLPVLSVAKDGSGNLYCVDEYGNTISQRTPDGNVSVVAGNSTQGYSGDTGPALAAQLFVDTYYVLPSGHGSIFSSTTVDNQGNLYIADTGNNVIRKVDAYGIINTVAGNYDLGAGYNGDNIAAVNAQLSQPAAVAVDAQGNLYIADTGNHRVRRVDQMTGIITTVAGSGTAGYSGDNGAAANAQLNNPAGLVFDASGSLYISDTGNDVIREVTFAPCN
jgi:sugar lactone lactonase YvrE